MQKMHCLHIQSNVSQHQYLQGLQRIYRSDMGCRGSEVQILSCRPKFPLKTSLSGLVFLCLQLKS
ncbi:hypothetical protein CKU68_15290 [Salmonella enterica]|nr:hypothetical protein [Salmonella enterica]